MRPLVELYLEERDSFDLAMIMVTIMMVLNGGAILLMLYPISFSASALPIAACAASFFGGGVVVRVYHHAKWHRERGAAVLLAELHGSGKSH